MRSRMIPLRKRPRLLDEQYYCVADFLDGFPQQNQRQPLHDQRRSDNLEEIDCDLTRKGKGFTWSTCQSPITNEYLSSIQPRYVEGTGQVFSDPTTRLGHGMINIFTQYVFLKKYNKESHRNVRFVCKHPNSSRKLVYLGKYRYGEPEIIENLM